MAQYLDETVEGRFEVIYDASSAVAQQTVQAATTGKSIFLTDITISTDTAQSVKLVDVGGGTIVARKFLPANGTWSKQYKTPKSVLVGSGLYIICSGGTGNVTVEAGGYIR